MNNPRRKELELIRPREGDNATLEAADPGRTNAKKRVVDIGLGNTADLRNGRSVVSDAPEFEKSLGEIVAAIVEGLRK